MLLRCLLFIISFTAISSTEILNDNETSNLQFNKSKEKFEATTKNSPHFTVQIREKNLNAERDNSVVSPKKTIDLITERTQIGSLKSLKNILQRKESNQEKTTKITSTAETKESRTNEDDEDIEPREEDFIEAADFGIQAMNDLYSVTEPKLYQSGLFLESNNPARFVAAFNEQTEEAKLLAKFGYASLEAAKKFHSKFPSLSRQAVNAQGMEKSTLRQLCPKRGIPECPPASMKYRTANGSCNNRRDLWWGSAMSTMQRFLPPVYEDGIQSIRRSITGNHLPSARHISDYIHVDRDTPLVSVTHMLMQWGQFIDHDITATGQSRAFNGSVPQCCLNGGAGFQPPDLMHPECLPISVHSQDSHLGRLGVRCMEFVRSGPAPKEDCEFGPREQLSQVTSFIDASTVYSSSARQSDSLRIFRNGLMQYGKLQSRRPVLPREDSDLCRRGSLSTSCFKAGDVRLSEQPALISLHVVFLRLHNRLATELSALNQNWSDEKIFQETRKIIGAIIQHITYREFLPIVLGHEVMKIFEIELLHKGYYDGYDDSVEPNIANEFSTAAYRFGHSLVQRSFLRFASDHRPIFNNVTIHEEFSNPINLETAGSVDRILLGLVNQPSQKRDEFISDELTNHLFQTPGFPFGMDLASLNVQRGRDHGIPPFVDWRQPCSLSPIKTWKDLDRVMSPDTAQKFRDLYDAVEDIDLFSAGLAEKPVVGGLVGPTFACIIAQQFRSLRKGDRFWYENPFLESGFTLEQLNQIRKVTLSQILCRTMDNIENIQPFVMLATDNLRNQRLSCEDPILEPINLHPWSEKQQKRDSLDSQQQKLSQHHSQDQQTPPPSQQEEQLPQEERESSDTSIEHEKVDLDTADVDIASRAAAKRKPPQQSTPTLQKPFKTKISQQNRIVVKRPLAPHENVTIVVNNHAVNAPVFLSDSIYGSNFHINQYPNSGQVPIRPQSLYQQAISSLRPSVPLLQDQPMQSTDAYYPHNFADPNNPNPPNYGFNMRPFNGYPSNSEYKPPYSTDNRPSLQDQHYPAQNQQDFYSTTKIPRPTQRPTTRPTPPPYNQNPESDLPTRPDNPYNQNSGRPYRKNYSSPSDIKDPYSYLEPNKSDRDEITSNYHPRPTKPMKQSSHGSENKYSPKDKPNVDYNSYAGNKYQTTTKRPNEEPSQYYPTNAGSDNSHYPTTNLYGRPQNSPHENWQNYNPPSSHFSGSSGYSNHQDTANKENFNYNYEEEEKNREMPHYIHTHTTISDIQYITNENTEKFERPTFEFGELPKPIRNRQAFNHENGRIKRRSILTNRVLTETPSINNRNFLLKKLKTII